jgi:hypothetical protein
MATCLNQQGLRCSPFSCKIWIARFSSVVRFALPKPLFCSISQRISSKAHDVSCVSPFLALQGSQIFPKNPIMPFHDTHLANSMINFRLENASTHSLRMGILRSSQHRFLEMCVLPKSEKFSLLDTLAGKIMAPGFDASFWRHQEVPIFSEITEQGAAACFWPALVVPGDTEPSSC